MKNNTNLRGDYRPLYYDKGLLHPSTNMVVHNLNQVDTRQYLEGLQ